MKSSIKTPSLFTTCSLILKKAIVLSLLFSAFAMADVAVITHPSSTSGSLDKKSIKSIYLGKMKAWPDGSTLTVIDQSVGSDSRILFLKKIIGKKEKKFDSYWSRKAFSGKGTPPKNIGTDADVKAWVASNKGSIGFINTSAVDSSVKVIMTIK